ncbi:hypothetical protein LAG90_00550 [Marinilongibacter aquaticus]|uniref:hypothetical protein n=1 Tax=Marinilongibacter aquaticus TaxID=2975157 RepID=UPI0021BD188E|nr:hypothetical protein [Marinilongibacter aquaticus]UBM59148.1 hypothetical protein LAG90_00550 [Marinilongibacter aquaticus]
MSQLKMFRKKPTYSPKALFLLPILSLSIWASSCEHQANKQDLIGAWKVDSTFTFYNGFSYTQTDEGSDWATNVYGEDGMMKEIKYGSYQSYRFWIKTPDTLMLEASQGGRNSAFAILKLNKNQLVLRKDKQPIFPGRNQTRYEIRYFSRTEAPTDSLIPFKDPRKTNP